MTPNFLRLSNRIINTNTIRTVWQDPVKQSYHIMFTVQSHSGMWMFGSGGLYTTDHEVLYVKDKHPEDYAVLDKWYNSFTS